MTINTFKRPVLLLFAAFTLAPSARAEAVPLTAALGFETVRLPGGEAMGLVGGTLLFDVDRDWAVGPAVYGAVSGRRGGFFVGGLEVQRRVRLGAGLNLAAGLYLGGGGGAAAPVGGGLMLRPALTLWKDLGPALQLGLSWSSVRFPSGQIASNQLGAVLAWRGEFAHLGERGTSSDAATGLGFDRIAATAGRYSFDDAGRTRRITLIGARAERRLAGGISAGIEAAAAAQGDAAGYMEILGTAAYAIEPAPAALPGWRVGVRGGLGAGGGGAVPTGGGLMVKLTATTEWRLAPGWTAGAEFGTARSARGDLHARQLQGWVAMSLEPRADGRDAADAQPVRAEWTGVWQHHTRRTRVDGTERPLDTIGLKLDRYLSEHVYLSGQAHSAFAGGAGAFSIGLVGAGLAIQPAAAWRFGAELLVGAAGGGGVSAGGGALVQTLARAGWSPSPQSEWRAGIGATRQLRGGGVVSPVIELGWSRAFGLANR